MDWHAHYQPVRCTHIFVRVHAGGPRIPLPGRIRAPLLTHSRGFSGISLLKGIGLVIDHSHLFFYFDRIRRISYVLVGGALLSFVSLVNLFLIALGFVLLLYLRYFESVSIFRSDIIFISEHSFQYDRYRKHVALEL